MSKPLFIFFGCSWTWGRYINWEQYNITHPRDMPAEVEAEQSALFSYRSLITKHFNADQLNFSEGGSSNDRQFRKAAEYFLGVKNESDNPVATLDRLQSNEVVVLWFITATSRKELYNDHHNRYDNFFLSQIQKPGPGRGFNIAKDLLSQGYYSDSEELKKLSTQMILWNSWFNQNNIKNVWIDTFNHNDWKTPIDNQVKFGSGFTDLMTNMYLSVGNKAPTMIEKHHSLWKTDEERSLVLKSMGYLNSVTLHPTVEGHKLISDLLIPKLETVIN
jgi:hypothetical protein